MSVISTVHDHGGKDGLGHHHAVGAGFAFEFINVTARTQFGHGYFQHVARLHRFTKARVVEAAGKLVYFMSVDNARFRKPVTPGDVLEITVTKLRSRGNGSKFEGKARADGVMMGADGVSGPNRDS